MDNNEMIEKIKDLILEAGSADELLAKVNAATGGLVDADKVKALADQLGVDIDTPEGRRDIMENADQLVQQVDIDGVAKQFGLSEEQTAAGKAMLASFLSQMKQ